MVAGVGGHRVGTDGNVHHERVAGARKQEVTRECCGRRGEVRAPIASTRTGQRRPAVLQSRRVERVLVDLEVTGLHHVALELEVEGPQRCLGGDRDQAGALGVPGAVGCHHVNLVGLAAGQTRDQCLRQRGGGGQAVGGVVGSGRLDVHLVDVGAFDGRPGELGGGVGDASGQHTCRCERRRGGRSHLHHVARERDVQSGNIRSNEASQLNRAVLLEVRVIHGSTWSAWVDPGRHVQEDRLGLLWTDLVEVGTAGSREVNQRGVGLNREALGCIHVVREGHVELTGGGVEAAPRDCCHQDRCCPALNGTINKGAQVVAVVGRGRPPVIHATTVVVVAKLHEQVVAGANLAQHLIQASLADEVLGRASADGAVVYRDVVVQVAA